jgi:hypothetical protein
METVSQKFPYFSMMFPGSFHVFPCGERDQGHRQGAASQSALTKNRARTGHSQKIVPGLEALTNGWSIKPGPERSEGPASAVLPLCTARTRSAVRVPCPDLKHRATGCNVWPGPERSEGPAFNALPRCYPRTRTKRGWALTKDRARTRSIGQPLRC